MPEFVAKPSKVRIALLLLGALAFVTAGLNMIGVFGTPPDSHRYSPALIKFVGWASILFFGAAVPISIRMFFDTQDQLRFDAHGIYWKRWSAQTIPWSEITDIGVWEFKRQKSIILNLRDPARFPSTTMMGKLASANRALTGGDIALTLAGTDGRFETAMEVIHHHWPPR